MGMVMGVVWGAVGVVTAIGALLWIWVVTGPPADEVAERGVTDFGGPPHTPESSDPSSVPW
jgi:hypothetical protein